MRAVEYPDAITMRGLPLHLSGWNGVYHKASYEKNGRPVWERPAHWYLGSLPPRILGTTIWFDGEAWVLHRDGDDDSLHWARSRRGAESPVGDWDGGYVKVSRAERQAEPQPASSR